MLSHEEARRVYDRIGSRQDTQAFYEDRAAALVLRHGDFGSAQRVFELGTGTGRFALRLLSEHLPATALYRGVDLSPTMVEIARRRLARYSPRAEVALSHGEPSLPESASSCDRLVSNYVLDLLSEEDIARVLQEAHRILRPGGLLCLSGLSTGAGPISRFVARAWERVHALRPELVGGCRPLDLRAQLPASGWHVVNHEHLAPFSIPSEVLVARRSSCGPL